MAATRAAGPAQGTEQPRAAVGAPAARDHLDMVAAHRSEMVATTPHGWFLWAGQDGVDVQMPDTLTAILAYARKVDADYVLFDADAPISPALPTYDWSD